MSGKVVWYVKFLVIQVGDRFWDTTSSFETQVQI